MTDHERQPEQEGKTQVIVNSMSRRCLPQISCCKSKPPLHGEVLIQKRNAASGVHLERASARHSGNLLSIHWMTRASGWTQRAAELPSCLRPGWRGITAQLRATTQDGPAPSKDDTHLPGVAALAYQALEQMVVLKKFARKKDHPLCHFIIKRLYLP